MADNSVDISVSVPQNGNSINVYVPGSTGEVTARDNLAQTYAEWAKLWAIKLGDKVNGQDYSSKYYAQESKKQAQISEINANSSNAAIETLKSNYDGYMASITETSEQLVTNIENITEKSLTDIHQETEKSIDNINSQILGFNSTVEEAKAEITALTDDFDTKVKQDKESLQEYVDLAQSAANNAEKAENDTKQAATEAQNNIKTAKDGALTDISTAKNGALSSISAAETTSLGAISAAKTDSLNKISESKTDSINQINTTSQNIIDEFTALGISGLEVSYEGSSQTLVFSNLEYAEITNELDSINGEVI